MQDDMICVTYAAKVVPVKAVTDRMTLCKMYVMSPGENKNNTIITQEAIEDAIPSIYNRPVVGLIYEDDNGVHMAGHAITVEVDENGNLVKKCLTVPFGVVPESCNPRFEDVEDSNGNKVRYLVVDVYLWTGRYPDLLKAVYDKDFWFYQSMEIRPSEQKKMTVGGKTKWMYTKFTFDALCLLGRSDDEKYNYRPCFQMAHVEPVKTYSLNEEETKSFNAFKQEVYELVGEGETMDEQTNQSQIEPTAAGINPEQAVLQDGEGATNFGEVEPAPVTEGDEGVQAPVDGGDDDGDGEGTPAAAPQSEEEPEQGANIGEYTLSTFEQTYREKYDRLLCAYRNAFPCKFNEQGRIVWSTFMNDFDDKYVYAYVCSDDEHENCSTYRASYVINSDETITFGDFEKVVMRYITPNEEAELEALRNENIELRQYKLDKEHEELEAKRQDELKQFSDLSGDEAFEALKTQPIATFEDVSNIVEHCYALRGRRVRPANAQTQRERIPILGGREETKGGKHEEFFQQYGNQ